MSMKSLIWTGVFIGGIIGNCVGNLLDHKAFLSITNFGNWAIIMSGVGSLVGIWVGYKISKNL